MRWPAFVLLVLAGCTLPRTVPLKTKPPEPVRTPPPRKEAPPSWRPSSDEVWLVEMIAQRLEVAMAAAHGRVVWSLPEPSSQDDLARLAAFAELASRAGLPPGPPRAFYAAQVEAAQLAAEDVRTALARRKDSGRATLAPASADRLLDALDTQMIATLYRMRMRTSTLGPQLQDFAREKLLERGIPKNAAIRATTIFDAKERAVFTLSPQAPRVLP